MNELFKTLRLAFYVCALPLVATAIASAHTWVNDDVQSPVTEELEDITAQPAGIGLQVQDVVPMHQHVLRIDETGGVSGRIMTREGDGIFGALGTEVSLNRRGTVIAAAVTSEDGQFRLENVGPGSYTFIASAPNCVSTFGVYVVADETIVPGADEVQLDVAAASRNIGEVRQLLNSEIESTVEYSYTPEESELVFLSANTQVAQGADGSLSGRVVPLQWLESETRFNLTGNDVYLFDESGQVARVPVAADGSYSIADVAPGVYDFVSFGPHGAAAMSIHVNPYDPVAARTGKAPFSLASTGRVVYQGGVDAVLGEPVAGGPPTTPPVDVQIVVQQPGGGGFGGGGMGGYGGYGNSGMGGFGELIGLALAAWVISEAVRNDRNDNFQQPVVVPPVVIPPNMSPF